MYELTDGRGHFCTVEKQTSGSFLPPLSKRSFCFERIIRSYKKFIQISKKDPLTQEFFRSTTGFLNERKRHAESDYSYVIHPFSDFAFGRELLLMFTYFSTFLTAPLITAFIHHGIFDLIWIYAIEAASTAIYFADIFVKCFVAVENRETKMVTLEQKIIVKKYVCSTFFLLDVVTAFSFFLIHGRIDVRKYYFLTYLRMLKIIRLNTFYKYWGHISQRLNFVFVAVEVIRYLIFTFILVHWFTCLTFYVPFLTGGADYKMAPDLMGLNKAGHIDMLPLYITSLFNTIGLLFCARTGWQENSPLAEIWMIIITLSVGKIYMLVLTVSTLNQVLNQWSLETKYLGIMDQLVEFMRYKKLPMPLRQRMKHYFDYKFQHRYFRENLITSILSDKLKREINIHVCKRLVQQASFLADLPTKVLGDVLVHLKAEVFLPNDIIIRAGAPGDCMYFLSSGTVLITTPSGKEVCHLTDGAYFGEIALLSKETKRTANVIALEICETYRLDKKIFKTCLRKNPECVKVIQTVAEMRHQKTNALEEMYKEELFHRTYIGDIGAQEVQGAPLKSHSLISIT